MSRILLSNKNSRSIQDHDAKLTHNHVTINLVSALSEFAAVSRHFRPIFITENLRTTVFITESIPMNKMATSQKNPSSGLIPDEAFIKTVEWNMLDKSKFVPMSMASSFTVRCFLYPLTLIRTRLQVQRGNEVYKGTYDAGKKIFQNEGFKGLYRGFFVSAFQVVSGVCYVSTYEGVRHILDAQGIRDSKVKAFLGGSCASLVGQTIIVPFDVISQHLMLLGKINILLYTYPSKLTRKWAVRLKYLKIRFKFYN